MLKSGFVRVAGVIVILLMFAWAITQFIVNTLFIALSFLKIILKEG